MLLSTRRERRLEGLLIAASTVGLAVVANQCVPDVQIVDDHPDAGVGGAGDEGDADTGGTSTGGTQTGTPGQINGPCLEDDTCIVGRCRLENSRCITGEYGDPCETDSHCVGRFCELAAGGAGGQSSLGTCGKYTANIPCGDDDSLCLSGSCSSLCDVGLDGATCHLDRDCDTSNCVDSTCRLLSAGAACLSGDAVCLSADCYPPTETCFRGDADSPCVTDTDCMSGICSGVSPDQTCDPVMLVAQTERSGVNEQDDILDVHFRIENRSDATIPVSELAFIYFFTESRDGDPIFQEPVPLPGNLAGTDFAAQFLAVGGPDWGLALTFPNSTFELAGDGTTTGDIQVQVVMDRRGGTFPQSTDFSWPSLNDIDAFGTAYRDNSRTVVCRIVDGTWTQVWGNSHPDYPNPCSDLALP